MRKILPIILLVMIGATVKATDYSFSTPGTVQTGSGRFVDAGAYFISSITVNQSGNLDSIILSVSTNGNAAQSAYAVLFNGTAGDITTYVAASTIVTVPNTYNPAPIRFVFTGVSVASGTYYVGFYNAGANSARCQLTSDNVSRTGYLIGVFPPSASFPNGSEYQNQGVANCFATAWVSSGAPPPTGSCCLADGSCVSGVTQASCSGTWTQGGSCTPNPCPQPSNPVAGVNVLRGAVYLGGVYGRPTVNTTFPLKVVGRYLSTASGFPYFINGETNWSLVGEFSYTEAYQYFQDRAARNFTAIMFSLPEPWYTSHSGNNNYNVAPFSTSTVASPNESYFALADSMLTAANQFGLACFVDPLYIGFGCSGTAGTGCDGLCSRIKASSFADMRTWGTYIGNRYKNYRNIVWQMGGDVDPALASLGPKVDTFVAALQQADNIYPTRVLTAHGSSGSNPMSTQFSSWDALNAIYTWDSTLVVSFAASAYAVGKPFVGSEFNYENGVNNISAKTLRSQYYWTILGGGCGHFYSNDPIWYAGATTVDCGNSDPMSGDWVAALTKPGVAYMQYARNLFVSRHWYAFVPDNTVITSGALTGINQATAARTSDATCLIAYLPTQRTVTINATSVQGTTVNTYWYNPATGATTTIGVGVTKTSSMSFTPPSAQDWVLVIDWVGTGNPVGQ